jgi:putative ABC transport system substrate-binding protein
MSSQNVAPYQQTIQGFEEFLGGSGRVEILHVSAESALAQLNGRAPEVVFALGASAFQQAEKWPGDPPILVTMVLSAANLNKTEQDLLVTLKPSVTQQLKAHAKFLPDARRVGVLYDPAESQQWVDEAEIAAKTLGLEVVAIAINTPHELPGALKALSRRADSILGIPDRTVYSSNTAKAILLFSYRNRIPFVGMSSAWVKAGALYSLDWDYIELGRQCGGLAKQILDGIAPAELHAQVPKQLRYHINLKSAEQFKLSFEPELIAGAAEVYR